MQEWHDTQLCYDEKGKDGQEESGTVQWRVTRNHFCNSRCEIPALKALARITSGETQVMQKREYAENRSNVCHDVEATMTEKNVHNQNGLSKPSIHPKERLYFLST